MRLFKNIVPRFHRGASEILRPDKSALRMTKRHDPERSHDRRDSASQWRKEKTASDDKKERNARFIFAGFDTGANVVLNDVIVLDGLIYAPVIFACLRRSGLCR